MNVLPIRLLLCTCTILTTTTQGELNSLINLSIHSLIKVSDFWVKICFRFLNEKYGYNGFMVLMMFDGCDGFAGCYSCCFFVDMHDHTFNIIAHTELYNCEILKAIIGSIRFHWINSLAAYWKWRNIPPSAICLDQFASLYGQQLLNTVSEKLTIHPAGCPTEHHQTASRPNYPSFLE